MHWSSWYCALCIASDFHLDFLLSNCLALIFTFTSCSSCYPLSLTPLHYCTCPNLPFYSPPVPLFPTWPLPRVFLFPLNSQLLPHLSLPSFPPSLPSHLMLPPLRLLMWETHLRLPQSESTSTSLISMRLHSSSGATSMVRCQSIPLGTRLWWITLRHRTWTM